jgi:nicotinamide mononucleotide (NMN) deamidase PncC
LAADQNACLGEPNFPMRQNGNILRRRQGNRVAERQRGVGSGGRIDRLKANSDPLPSELIPMADNPAPTPIEKIHASGRQLMVAITGGGSGAIAELLAVPDASASVLEAVVPYSLAALEDWLGGKVDHACSERAARAMAMAAFERARALSSGDPHQLIGIGATASLVSTRPKRGPHRVHAAWQTATATVAYSVELAKGQRLRAEEEAVAARLVLAAVTESCGVAAGPLSGASSNEPITRREKVAPPEWAELLLGERQLVGTESHEPRRAIFSGAFNPIHAGHRRMAEIASKRLGRAVVLELSITNVDKPPLDFIEIDDRLQQLAGFPVVLSRAPTFVEKSAILPGSTFVVGADTIARIADPIYYGGSVAERDAAFESIVKSGGRFLVFGREVGERFVTLSDLDLPEVLRRLCDEVPEAEFRDDSASTKLRTGL